MMPNEKMAQFSSAPPLKRLKSAATPPPALCDERAEPLLQHRRIHAGSGDRRAEAHDHDDREGEQNPPAQLRDLDAC